MNGPETPKEKADKAATAAERKAELVDAVEKAARDSAPRRDADDESADEPGKVTKRPKRATGKFVAAMNIELWNPKSKIDPKTKAPIGGRVTILQGQVMPDYCSEAELARFQENGAIEHEYR
jgi:hypothetical protein